MCFGYEKRFFATFESFECFSSCVKNRFDADGDGSRFFLFEGGILDFLSLIAGTNGFPNLLDTMAERCGE